MQTPLFLSFFNVFFSCLFLARLSARGHACLQALLSFRLRQPADQDPDAAARDPHTSVIGMIRPGSGGIRQAALRNVPVFLKGIAQKIVYGAFERVAEKTDKPAIEVFEEAMNNIMPVLEVKARRIGGATYQVPIEVRADRRQALALRWLTNFSRARGEKTMEERLANEIMDAANNTGAAVKRKEDMHKMAEANKAFAHYRF